MNSYCSEILRDLDECSNDANDVFNALKKLNFHIYKDRFFTGDIGRNDLREAIVEHFTNVYKTTDIVIFYFSGHGILSPAGEPYLCATDTDPAKPIDKGLSFSDLLNIAKECKSINVLLILDCCYSGEIVLQKKIKEQVESLNNPRICVIASSLPLAESFILPGYQNSIFTHFLVDCLNGSGEAVDKDGILTVPGVFMYIYKNLIELDICQEPVYNCYGEKKLSQFPEYKEKNITSSLLSDLKNLNEMIISNKFKNSSEYINQILNSEQLAKTYYLRGATLFNQRKFEDAITNFSQSYSIDKKLVQALVSNGICYGEIGQFGNARKQFRMALKNNPNDEKIIFNIGLSYLLEQNYKESMKIFIKMLTKDTENVDALSGLGTCYGKIGNIICAMACFQQVLKREPHDTVSKNNLAQAYSEFNEHERALEIISKLVSNNPDDFRFQLSKGLILYRKSDYKEAIAYFEKTALLEPILYEPYFYKGMCYGNLNENGRAIHAFKDAIKRNSNEFNVWYNLGVANDKLGRLTAALVCYNISTKINETYDGVYHATGVIFMKQRKYLHAIHNFLKAVDLNAYDVDSMVNLATSYASFIPYNNLSIDYLHKVIELTPNDIEILVFLGELHYMRGVYYADANELNESILLLQRAIKFDENNEKARSLISLNCDAMKTLGKSSEACLEF
jgi:tetratricopeptide (TPR) repeat protein